MSKKSSPSLPPVPTYQTDPTYTSGLKQLMGLGTDLTNGNFSGSLSWLADTTTINPSVIQGFYAGLQPAFEKTRQDTINTLAANNQLESSTTANALTQQDLDLQNTMLGYGTTLQNQALQNRIGLFGTGLNTLSTGTGMAQGNQNTLNNFNLANYENMVAKAMAEQKQSSGGLMGSLTGGIGGALLGGLLAAPTGGMSLGMGALLGGGAGGLLGGFGPSGTGGSILSAGAGAAGSGMNNRLLGTTNNPFRGLPGVSAMNSIGYSPTNNFLSPYGLSAN